MQIIPNEQTSTRRFLHTFMLSSPWPGAPHLVRAEPLTAAATPRAAPQRLSLWLLHHHGGLAAGLDRRCKNRDRRSVCAAKEVTGTAAVDPPEATILPRSTLATLVRSFIPTAAAKQYFPRTESHSLAV